MAETKEYIRGNKYVVEKGGTLLHFQQNNFSDSKGNWEQERKEAERMEQEFAQYEEVVEEDATETEVAEGEKRVVPKEEFLSDVDRFIDRVKAIFVKASEKNGETINANAKGWSGQYKFYVDAERIVKMLDDLRQNSETKVKEYLDSGMIGNVLHKVMQVLYSGRRSVDAAFIAALRKDKDRIRSLTDKYICLELNTFEVSGRNLVLADIICRYIDAVLAADAALSPLSVLGTERKAYVNLGGFRFKGYIDRLDSGGPGRLRVVDYKTDRVQDDDLEFSGAGLPKIGFQLYVYKRMMEQAYPGARITGAIYQPAALLAGAPVLELPLDTEYCDSMQRELDGILSEISDLSVPWTRTGDVKKCEWCNFRTICGR